VSSSTSSSDLGGRGRWGLAWLCALVLAASALGAFEAFWRAQGHRPDVTDGLELWSYYRHGASLAGRRAIALLGTSRMLADVSLPTLGRRARGHGLFPLALDGSHPMATLRDLADDPTFGGIVLCELTEESFAPTTWDSQAAYVAHSRTGSTWPRRVSARARALLQAHLALTAAPLSLPTMIARGYVPRPRPQVVTSERQYACDPAVYPRALIGGDPVDEDAPPTPLDATVDVARGWLGLRRFFFWRTNLALGEVAPGLAQHWDDWTAEVERSVARLEARGSRVVFLRFPTSGKLTGLYDKFFPRAHFWDVFASRTHAVVVRSEDVPGMSGFSCPDSSHLCGADPVAFTEALADELVRRGVLGAAP
jgi:hypothetical protein